MTDLHCHLLPYVDDGAHTLADAIALLELEKSQGVRELCLTPHLREGIFETEEDALQKQFLRLKALAEPMGLTLHLSREYHWDALTRERLLGGEILPLGKRGMLTEFSPNHSGERMLEAAKEICQHGFVPVIAHVERYPATDRALASALRAAGARIQVNADALLGYDGRYAKKLAWALLQWGLVDVVASDAHSVDERPPRMAESRARLRKKLGEDAADRLTRWGPRQLLGG